MKIFRQGKFLQKTVRLTAAPKAIGLAQKYQVPQLGFEIRELTRDILYQENLPLSTPGVFVFQVDRASPAGLAGLSIGSLIQRINEQPVKNLAAAQKIIEQELNDKTQKIMLQVLEHRSTRFVFIDLKK
ncbi:MAG TPA: PDZ domain-containing protein [Caldithrix sp.]|nr:PDZ domain-containing protein [Caldithrix sp.]